MIGMINQDSGSYDEILKIILISLILVLNQFDADGFAAVADAELTVAELGCRHHGFEIITESVGFFRNAEHPLVHLAVAVFVVVHRNGVVTRLDRKQRLNGFTTGLQFFAFGRFAFGEGFYGTK